MVRVRCFDSVRAAELKAAWQTLEERGVSTPFQKFRYAEPMEKCFLNNSKSSACHCLVEWDGEPALIVPLVQFEKWGVKTITFLDYYVADHQFPIFDAALLDNMYEHIDQAALENSIRSALPRHDVLSSRRWLDTFEGYCNPLGNLFGAVQTQHHSLFLDLGEDAMENTRKQHSIYKKARRKWRRMQEEMGLHLCQPKDAETASRFFDSMLDMRKARFHSRGVTDSLSQAETRAFFRTLCLEGCPQENAVLTALCTAEGEPIAVSFANRSERTLIGQIFAAQDGPWMKHSPGVVTLFLELEWAIQRGLTTYDMGAGDEAYKRDFGGAERHLVSAARPNSTLGHAHLQLTTLKKRVKPWVQRLRGSVHAQSPKSPKSTA